MKEQELTRSSEEKRKFLDEHFRYEVDMLYHSFVKLVEFQQASDQPSINMALETFIFHARNLMHFLYEDSRRKKRDARAYDFLPSKDVWRSARPKKTASLQMVEERVDPEMAHLTYKRPYGTPEKKQWPCGNILTDLIKVVNVFLEQLPDEYKINGLMYNRVVTGDKSPKLKSSYMSFPQISVINTSPPWTETWR